MAQCSTYASIILLTQFIIAHRPSCLGGGGETVGWLGQVNGVMESEGYLGSLHLHHAWCIVRCESFWKLPCNLQLLEPCN